MMFQWIKALALHLMAVRRGVYLGGTGAVVLASAALLPWSESPSSQHSFLSATGEVVLVAQPHWTEVLARLTAGFGAVYFLVVILSPVAPSKRSLRLAWIMTAYLLAFPCWHNLWADTQVADKRLLFREMNRVIDDMEKNSSEQQTDWRDWQSFARSTQTRVVAICPPEETWHASQFAPQQWYADFEDLPGISHEFLGFFKPSLLAALLGSTVLLLLGLHLASGLGMPGFRRGLASGLLWLGLFLAVSLLPRAVGEYLLAEGEAAMQRGDQAEALRAYQTAARWKPGLRHSWWYHDQIGQITRLQDRATLPEPHVAAAYENLQGGRAQLSVENLRRAQALTGDDSTIQGFLALALSDAGIAAFNAGQHSLARDYWQESLSYVPIDPMPWYGLSLVHLRQKDFEQAVRCIDQLVRLQESLGYGRLTVRSQAFVTQAWAAAQRGDWPQAHALYTRALNPDAW
jgi:tetratricopeptide (TPR) repeat protein